MALWDKLMGELVDIVEWLDDTNDTLAYRFERYQNEIKYGAKLVVREGQVAVFVNEGQLADVFKPGTHTLTTQNLPILATLKGWKYGFNSPFKAEVYFCSTHKFTDLKWGTPGPAMMRDKDFGVVRATAFGLYAIRVKDAGTFVKDLVGTDNRFTLSEIQENLRGKIGLRIKEVMPELGIPVLDLEAKVTELGSRLRERLAAEFEGLGIELVEVQVQDIGLPEEVEKAMDKRGAMAAIGNLQAYAQYETASAIRDAANNPGGAAGVAVGLVAGRGLSSFSATDDLPLHALATHGNDSMAIATGPITDNMEGLVTLDFLTGEMKLFVLSHRTGKFVLGARQNVLADLAIEKGKKPAFLLAMGGSTFIQGGAALQPASSTVYVCDANTGNFMAYGIQYSSTAYKSATPSQAVFLKLDAGKARDLNLGE